MSGGYVSYRAARWISTALPRRVAYWIGLRLAGLCYRANAHGREAITANLRHIQRAKGIESSDRTLSLMARQTFDYFGKYLVDFFRYCRMTRSDVGRMVSTEGLSHLDAALEQGRGALIVTAHFGNWELGGASLAALGYKMNAVALPEQDSRTNELFMRCRSLRGLNVIPLGHAGMGCVRSLQRKECLALLGDRDYTPHHIWREFFGVQTQFPAGPARLSLRMRTPVVPAFMVRQEDDTFLLKVHQPFVPGPGMQEQDVLDAVIPALELEIGLRPTQWFMFDFFWKNGRSRAGTRVNDG